MSQCFLTNCTARAWKNQRGLWALGTHRQRFREKELDALWDSYVFCCSRYLQQESRACGPTGPLSSGNPNLTGERGRLAGWLCFSVYAKLQWSLRIAMRQKFSQQYRTEESSRFKWSWASLSWGKQVLFSPWFSYLLTLSCQSSMSFSVIDLQSLLFL